MTKWMSIVIGIVVLTAIFLFVRFVSVSGNALQQSEQPSTNQIKSASDPAPDSVASRLEQRPLGNGNGSSGVKLEATDAQAVQSVTRYQGLESGGPIASEIVGREPENSGIDMPGLVIPPEGAYGAGTGPSQEDFGLPGPELDARDLADAGASRQATESAPVGLEPPAGNDLLNTGPSQTDLGLPGPGQEESQTTESSRFDAGLTDDQDEDQPLPAR